MKLYLASAALLLPAALFAQSQIGGGQCSSATLSGNYSLTLSGRQLEVSNGPALGPSLLFASALQGVGTATFDGLNKVTLALTNNTNTASGTAASWSGTYSLQSNCIGQITLTGTESATFTLGSYSQGSDFFIDGYDGTYSLLGNGSTLPSSCSASLLNGTYSFNGNGFVLSSSSGSGSVGSVTEISGLLTFNGTSAVTTTWYLSVNGATQNTSTSGTYTVNSNCTASASVADSSGNKYALQFVITAAKGTNFLVDAAGSTMLFVGSGRTL